MTATGGIAPVAARADGFVLTSHKDLERDGPDPTLTIETGWRLVQASSYDWEGPGGLGPGAGALDAAWRNTTQTVLNPMTTVFATATICTDWRPWSPMEFGLRMEFASPGST